MLPSRANRHRLKLPPLRLSGSWRGRRREPFSQSHSPQLPSSQAIASTRFWWAALKSISRTPSFRPPAAVMELRGCAEGQSSTMTDASSPPTARRRPSDEKARALATGSLASLSASSPVARASTGAPPCSGTVKSMRHKPPPPSAKTRIFPAGCAAMRMGQSSSCRWATSSERVWFVTTAATTRFLMPLLFLPPPPATYTVLPVGQAAAYRGAPYLRAGGGLPITGTAS
mmetsp:Transcript_10317/g.31049  ORF Transcript_10317/g.31049 Transcript_10317/m.31049 type:complete len:229 (+) Transcript_10317:924-1610(+)